MSVAEWYRDERGQMRPRVVGSDAAIAWAPLPGSQQAFLECTLTEALYAGTRGPGKSTTLLMDFLQHVGQGWGTHWKGWLFRRQQHEHTGLIAESHRWISEIFPRARWHDGKSTWTFPDGETLRFTHIERPSEYYRFHGSQVPWIGFEELTSWASDECYRLLFSCLRSPVRGIPLKVRANTNPGGVGHNWVKTRFDISMPPEPYFIGPIIETPGQPDRVVIHGRLRENLVLLNADPDYEARIRAAAVSPMQLKAWLEGSWDIVAGGMVDDLWDVRIHVIPPVPPALIPTGWRLDRAFDHGSAAPFSVGWWAQSSGDPLVWEGRELGVIRGDLLRVAEWYGWNGQPNKGILMAARDIAKGIVEREEKMGVRGRVRAGPADSNIWNSDPRDPGASVATDMLKAGVSWERAHKGPGSRKQGWLGMRDMLKGAIPDREGVRENPGLFVSSACRQFLRTIPVLPRDESDPDDVDSESEDHIADETSYRVRRPRVVETPQKHLVF